MSRLLRSTAEGRTRSAVCKLGISLLVMLPLYFGTYLPQLVNVYQEWGLPQLSVPLKSLAPFQECSYPFSILGFLLILYLIRFAAMAASVLLIDGISQWSKNTLVTVLSSVVILLLPLLLQNMGVGISNYTLAPLLTGNEFLQNNLVYSEQGWGFAMNLLAVVIVSLAAVLGTVRSYSKSGFRITQK